MKTLILTITAFFIFQISTTAQIYCQGINLNEDEDIVYISVHQDSNWKIDFGKNKPLKGSFIKNAEGKAFVSVSFTGMINHLENNGWSYVDKIATSSLAVKSKQYFLFKKK